MIQDIKYYLNRFSVTHETLDALLAEALSSGGSYADLFFEDSFTCDLVLRDSVVGAGSLGYDYGVGIRVLDGDKTGYAYSESTETVPMMEAARAAAAISSRRTGACTCRSAAEVPFPGSGIPDFRQDLPTPPRYAGKPNPAADRYPMNEDWRQTDTRTMVPHLLRLEKSIREKDSRVIKVIAMISSQVSDILMANSFGEIKYETRPMATVSASVIFRQGEKTENKSVSRSFRMGAEMITDALIDELAADAVSGIDERFEARRPKGGKMKVVMGAGASGILLHEAMGHAFEADFNRKGQSIFSDRMGKQICPSNISIVDDATIHANRGSLNFDDEGVPGQKTWMVENGVLTSYLHDRISAGHYGVRPTGNGRRESFRYNPIPRMRATYMEGGDCPPEDIIGSVRKGIYVDQFSNGQVKIGEGDFTFYVKSGFLIEDGHLTMPVKDINIIGNGPKVLAGIKMVGNDLKIDNSQWTCGKEQNAPVSCGIPTVLVEGLTVGGE